MPTVDRPPANVAATRCPSCGAAFVADAAALATACAWCGSRLVDAATAQAVDRVVPFRITARAAQQRLRAHVADAFWAPRAVRLLARTGQLRPEELRGVLVPYFVYAASTQAKWRARIGVDWWRTERTRDREGKSVTRRVRETEWFDAQGTAVGDIDGHHVCASTTLTGPEVARLGRFDLGLAVGFDPRLAAGFAAELPTRARAELDADARATIRRAELRRLAKDVLPGDHHDVVAHDCEVSLRGFDVVLMPVWVATYRHAGRVHRLLVHGQRGDCVGRPPISTAKVSLAAGLVAALVLALLWWGGAWS